MGALTLKSFPFELRGWDIEKVEAIDPTDSFGSDVKIYVSKDQIIQIEPDYNIYNNNNWLTDKGRQFFDGIFNTTQKHNVLNMPSWLNILNCITQTLYIFEHCSTQQYSKNYLIIIFENLSLELLSLINILAEKNSFIKIRKAENFKINNDLETNFQLNSVSNKLKLNNSNLCLLISTNTRYEGYYLNLNLRQRYLKGNFKCLMIGSLINLTFPISFLGSNLNVLKTIVEGNNIVCQELKSSKNPILIHNYEMLKRNDGKNNFEMLQVLKHANIINQIWNGFNVLSPSLSETGTQLLNKFLPLTEKDLINFSSLYFLNIAANNITNLKKMTELKLLNYKNSINKNQLLLDQTSIDNSNYELYASLYQSDNKNLQKYIHLPSTMFYENEETYVNTEGFFKRTNKLIFRKKSKESWKIVRKILKHLKTNLYTFNEQDNNLIYYNCNKFTNFKNYINFQYQATQTLTSINFFLSLKNESFTIFNLFSNFKHKRCKIKLTKLKYWIDDFFNGGTDEYSQNSMVLSHCSKILRDKNTNFF